jgi:hypothetical protein
MKLELTTVFRRNDEIIHSAIDNETVMMSIEQDEYYGLDEVGTRIWNILEEPHSTSEIIEFLEPDYDVDRKQMENDVLSFLEEMVSGKVLYTK